jgi:hypothetical protein
MRSALVGVLGVLVSAGAASAQTWNIYSRSANNAFMADAESIVRTEDVSTVTIAMVPLHAEAGDYSHSLETYDFQCAQNRWRPTGVAEMGPDGAEVERFPEEGAEWEPVRSGTNPAYLKEVVCDGARSDTPWASVRAFVDAGRP